MVERVRQKLRDLAVGKEPSEIAELLNREHGPVLKELRQRFNELSDFNAVASFATVTDETDDLPESRLLTAGTGISLVDSGPGAALTVTALGFSIADTLTGAANTLTAAHLNKWTPVSHTAATVLTVPPNSSVPAAVGAYFIIEQRGAGLLSIAAGAGVTIQYPVTMVAEAAEQYSVIGLVQVAADSWRLLGDAGLA